MEVTEGCCESAEASAVGLNSSQSISLIINIIYIMNNNNVLFIFNDYNK